MRRDTKIMYEMKDTFEDIALSKTISVLCEYADSIFKENGYALDLLKSIGLTDVAERFEDELNPYSFYKGYKNRNDSYNPVNGIHGIVEMIKSNNVALGRFLKAYIEKLKNITEEEIEVLSNNLNVIGYVLEVYEVDSDIEIYKYTIIASIDGVVERRRDISYLTNNIEQKHNAYLHYYKEAITKYGNSHYGGTISNCRILIEKIFEKEDTDNNDHNKGFLKFTGEITPNGSSTTPKLTVNGIFNYWVSEKKGFNRYRLLVTIYSMFSGLGSHAEEIPSKSDALLCLRLTEDILVWAYQQNKF
jgi:hypothetical protein